jgi:hypothetical protein
MHTQRVPLLDADRLGAQNMYLIAPRPTQPAALYRLAGRHPLRYRPLPGATHSETLRVRTVCWRADASEAEALTHSGHARRRALVGIQLLFLKYP